MLQVHYKLRPWLQEQLQEAPVQSLLQKQRQGMTPRRSSELHIEEAFFRQEGEEVSHPQSPPEVSEGKDHVQWSLQHAHFQAHTITTCVSEWEKLTSDKCILSVV